jgi:hypothetical protein
MYVNCEQNYRKGEICLFKSTYLALFSLFCGNPQKGFGLLESYICKMLSSFRRCRDTKPVEALNVISKDKHNFK